MDLYETTRLLLIGTIVGLLYWLYKRNKIILDDRELLEFVSYTRWKSGRRICKEIMAKYRGWISYAEFYIRMQRLEEDGFIEKRDKDLVIDGEKIKTVEFKKLHGGGPPKKIIIHESRKELAVEPQAT